jgi:hypothetical protein
MNSLELDTLVDDHTAMSHGLRFGCRAFRRSLPYRFAGHGSAGPGGTAEVQRRGGTMMVSGLSNGMVKS